MKKKALHDFEVDKNHVTTTPLVSFSTTRGVVTVKTTLYPLPVEREEIRPWIEAQRIEAAKREAAYRADQLNPVVKRQREYTEEDFGYDSVR